MREDPGLDVDEIVASLKVHYGLHAASATFLPIGYDRGAAVYEIVSRDGSVYFLKVRFGSVHEPSLLVPRALIELGISNVLAPCGRYPRTYGARSVATTTTASSSTRS